MRIWHRFKTLLPLLLAIAVAAEASAQNMPGYPSYGAPAYSAGPPQGYPGSAGQGTSSFQPHPMISPFDNAFEQHYNSDGVWYKRLLTGMTNMNDYRFNVSLTKTKYRTLRGNVGDETVPTFDQDNVRNNATTFPEALFLPTFDRHDMGQLLGNKHYGIKIGGGVENKMGWGFSWNVGYDGSSTNVWDSRANLDRLRGIHFFEATALEASGGIANGLIPGNLSHINEREILETQILNARIFDSVDIDTFGVAGSTFEILDRTLYPHGGLGLRNNDDIDGFSQLFDLDFRMEHEIESHGAGFHFSSSPIYETDNFRIRPIIGARYFHVKESFRFRGADSGLAYVFSQPNGLDDDGDFVIDNVDENGTLGFVNPLLQNPAEEIIVRSFVDSHVRSSMAGPEIGVDYEITKKRGIKFSGSTRAGALINTEKMYLAGDNIGDTFALGLDLTTGEIVRTDLFDTSTAGGRQTENFFTDSNSSTHVSPMLEQTLNADIPIFSKIPILRDKWQLEHAKLRLGFTYTWIGEVADPNNSIVWVSDPQDGLFPFLSTKRTDFFKQQFDVGINWEF